MWDLRLESQKHNVLKNPSRLREGLRLISQNWPSDALPRSYIVPKTRIQKEKRKESNTVGKEFMTGTWS